MNLLFVFILGLVAAEENIAGKGIASQTDTEGKAVANLAIDGNTNGLFEGGSVIQTKSKGKNAVWTLDFSESYYVTSIKVWRREGTYFVLDWGFSGKYADLMTGVILRLDGGEKNILVTLDAAMGNPAVIDVNDEVTRVSLTGANGHHLTFAEVEVFGYAQDNLPTFENVGPKGSATQVDNHNKDRYFADEAIDGITFGTDWNKDKSFTHTDSKGKDAWWRLEFDESYYVTKIRVWNRYNNHARLNGATVRINDQSDILAILSTTGEGNPMEIEVNGVVKSIMITGGDDYLSLAEVEVFAIADPENIAGEGEASQSNNKNKKKWLAQAAIDGNTDGRLKKKSVSRTKKKGLDASWSLDFSQTYYVSTIKIWSSIDKCCAKKLKGATLRLDGGQKNILATLNTDDGNPMLIDVNDGVNRITITAGGKNFLTIAEVEVFGFAKADFVTMKNVAAKGQPTQSTNISGNKGLAKSATDGNTDGRYAKRSVTHTEKKGKDPWWRLDFSEEYYVSQIRIWNRVDSCCFEELDGALLTLDDGRASTPVELNIKEGNPIVINVGATLNGLTITGVKSYLSLAEVEVFGNEVKKIPTNIADKGVASQSDDYFKDKGFAKAAIDGNTNGKLNDGSVTHTSSKGLDAFWKLDFSETYYVSKIQIWNREDAHSDRLNGVTVRLYGGKKNIFTSLNTKMGNPIVIDVDDGLNRIIVTGSTSHLSLAEVEVFGYADPGFVAIENIASEGIASQTDTSNEGFPNLAIDGNTDGRFHEGSVTHTKSSGKNVAWKLTFSESYYVTKILVWNRVESSDRINGAILRLDGGEKNIIATLDKDMGNPLVIDVNDEVELVTIIGGNGHILSLAEVEVFGYLQDDLPKFENVAATGTASQRDNYSSSLYGAEKAIDGNTLGTSGTKSFSHTKTKGNLAWWRLDFKKSYYVSKIRVWNRYDNNDRLNGVTVRINDKDDILATLSSAGKGNPVEIKVDGDVRSIKINGSENQPLALAEVEVFAVSKE